MSNRMRSLAGRAATAAGRWIPRVGHLVHAAPPRHEADELLDQTGHDPAELAASLRDVRRINRYFGGVGTITRNLPALLAAAPPDRPLTALDLATGSADIPLAIAAWVERAGRTIEITATDRSEEILAVAARRVVDHPRIKLARCDARATPFADASFDFVFCSLALHHFPPGDAVCVLREMNRLARVGFIVNDLARSYPGYLAAWLVSRLGTRNRVTRHDAPLSARRAYTSAELAALLNTAGIEGAAVTRHRWFRMAATKVVPRAPAQISDARRSPEVPVPRPRSIANGADAEVIVVGAGPAGSASAMWLAESGHRVLLLDKAGFPRHKACSEYINPAAVRILHELGLGEAIAAAGPHQMEAMLVHAPDGGRYRAAFDGAAPGEVAWGLSRFRLDHLLLQRAEAAGATVYQRAHVRDLLLDGGRVVGVEVTRDGGRETIRAPLVIGADGRHSLVTRRLALDAHVRWPRRTGLVAHYRGMNGLDRWGELHVVPGAYVGLALLEDDLACVALVTDVDAVAARVGSVDEYFNAHLAQIPAVAEKQAGAERIGPIRGVGSMAHRVRRVAGDGFLLVGDAAGFLDPFTGEGIYEALRGAQLAAPIVDAALRAGDTSAPALAPYAAARRQAFSASRGLGYLVQGFVHSPPLMNYVVDRLDRRRHLGSILASVVSDLQPAGLALSPVYLARLLRP